MEILEGQSNLASFAGHGLFGSLIAKGRVGIAMFAALPPSWVSHIATACF